MVLVPKAPWVCSSRLNVAKGTNNNKENIVVLRCAEMKITVVKNFIMLDISSQ